MTYLPSGKIDDGPLSTDRPHTGKAYGFYRLKWGGSWHNPAGYHAVGIPGHADQHLPAGGRHLFGLPVGRRVVAISCNFTRAANGDFVVSGIVKGRAHRSVHPNRCSFHHEIRFTKASVWSLKPT